MKPNEQIVIRLDIAGNKSALEQLYDYLRRGALEQIVKELSWAAQVTNKSVTATITVEEVKR